MWLKALLLQSASSLLCCSNFDPKRELGDALACARDFCERMLRGAAGGWLCLATVLKGEFRRDDQTRVQPGDRDVAVQARARRRSPRAAPFERGEEARASA